MITNNLVKENKNEFFERLWIILDYETPTFWSEKIGVSASTISGRWRKGSYPSLKSLFKICEHTKVSANWLLFGIGDKYMDANKIETDPGTANAEIRQYATEMIYSMQEKIYAIESNINTIELLKWFSEKFPSFDKKKLNLIVSLFDFVENEGKLEDFRQFFNLIERFIEQKIE